MLAKKPIVNSVLYLFLICVAIIQIVPLLWLVLFSLKDNVQIFGERSLNLPNPVIWENYKRAFIAGGVGKYFFNSVVVSASTVLLVMLFSSMVAYATIRMQWKLKKIVFTYFLMGLMIPIHSGLLPIFVLLQKSGLLNTRLALIIPYSAFGLSMAIMIISGFIGSIPREIEEAASIDGAHIYRIFFSLIIPLLKPALASIIILTCKNAWNELMMATVFVNDPALKTITAGIKSLHGEYLTEWGVVGAGLMIASLPMVIMYIIFSDKIQHGLIAGAVKS